MKNKFLILMFSLLLAVGWTSNASAQLKADPSMAQKFMPASFNKASIDRSKVKAQAETNGTALQKVGTPIQMLDLTKFAPRERINDAGLASKLKAPNRAPRRAQYDITANKTMTRAEYEAITYNWVDADGLPHPDTKLTEPASDPYQIAYLLGSTYMNQEIPGIKYSAFYDQDHPYPNIEFGWDIPSNARWDGIPIGPTAASTTTTNTWSWAGATDGTTLPAGWTISTNNGLYDNGDGTWFLGGNTASRSITIPARVLAGYTINSVVIRAKMDAGISGKSISVNGVSQSLTNTLANYTWNNVNASNGIIIEPTDGYVGIASITITGTSTSGPSGGGLTIAAYGPVLFSSITVYNQNNTVLTSWDATTAINNGQISPYQADGQTYYFFNLPGWNYSVEMDVVQISGNYYGLLAEEHINIPPSLLNGASNIRVVVNGLTLDGYEGTIVVNGEEKPITTSAANYTWTTEINTPSGSVIPPDDNGYTVFLVKAKDYVGIPPHFTYSWNNNDSYTSLINYFSTYIDEVQLLTDGTRLNENTDDAGTMFAYSGDLNKFYFISKGANYWFGSSEADYVPHYSPTYDMYEEFSPTTTAAGDQITDFYSKLLYGNSYNVIHDCRGVNVMQHYFSMSGNTGEEHKSMTNLIFWIPDHRGQQDHQNNYDEEYLPHVGLYTITLEATAVPSETQDGMYDVTCDWVSSLNSILDFPVDQDYELWIYIYDEEGNPIEQRMVTDDLHNTTTYTYPEEQWDDSRTIIYRVYGWPSAATNSRGNGGDFYALSNLDPVLIPGRKNFLALDAYHYESDFVIDEEHNYYRNFLTVDNQNPDNSLTADRIAEGDSVFSLYRFDATVENPQEIKAADLKFSVKDNKVNYRINYDNQAYIDDAHLYNEATQSEITGYRDLDALGYPTSGTIATLGGGETPPDPVVIETHTSTVTASRISSASATWTGTGGETWNVAVTGGATNQNVTNGYAQIGTGTNPSTSVTFSTSGIEGTIKSIVVNCASYNGLATLRATVGGTAFGTQNQSTPTWSSNNGGNVTFSGSASGAIVITMTNGNRGRVMYIKSIVVTYETSNEEVSYITITDTWGFETQADLNGWSPYDYDQDGNNWGWLNGEEYASLAHTGNGFVFSDSYNHTPDNWLMSPEITLGGTLTLWARRYSQYNTTERFGVYVLLQGQTQWQLVGSLTNAAANWTEYSFDLSAYAGQRGQFMIDHWNTSANQYESYLFVDDITYTISEQDTHATGGFSLLNDFLDYRFYEQVGIVVFDLPWKSIQVKLQDESSGTSAGYFMIQSGGKLRFIMPAGYNNANVKFVIRNAPLSSNYHDGTFTLSSTTGQTQTVTFAATDGGVDREVIFTGVSTGDVITITGTHYVDGTLYNYSPDFQFIRVYVQGGTGGISENDALNLAAIQFVDQFKAETSEDKHPYRYGYVLRYEGDVPQESAKPEVPVQHTGATMDGYYSLSEIDNDKNIGRVDEDGQILHDQGITMNVMNGQVEMKLTSNPEVYYYTLDRKPSTEQNAEYEEISKLQKREDDTYQEMDNILSDYQNIFQPVTTPRFDNYDVQTGDHNDYMNYVPIVWTHGDQDNRRIKWNAERRHNSYGAPIWKTGVGDALLYSATAEKQEGWNTTWMDGDTKCRLYLLDGIEAWGYLPSPTVTNVEYEPYMFRVFVESKSGKLRNFTYETVVGEDGKTNEVITADVTTDDEKKVPKCVWSAYLNPYDDEVLAELNEACDNNFGNGNDGTYDFIKFTKGKVERTAGYDENGVPLGEWDQQETNAFFGLVDDIRTIMQDNVEIIDPDDLTIFVRFYYIVKGASEGWTPWNPNRAAGNDPAGYGAESPGKAPNPATAVNEVRYVGEIVSQTYYNIQGMMSDKPFEGVNIVVTRYSDGSSSVAKIIR